MGRFGTTGADVCQKSMDEASFDGRTRLPVLGMAFHWRERGVMDERSVRRPWLILFLYILYCIRVFWNMNENACVNIKEKT